MLSAQQSSFFLGMYILIGQTITFDLSGLRRRLTQLIQDEDAGSSYQNKCRPT